MNQVRRMETSRWRHSFQLEDTLTGSLSLRQEEQKTLDSYTYDPMMADPDNLPTAAALASFVFECNTSSNEDTNREEDDNNQEETDISTSGRNFYGA